MSKKLTAEQVGKTLIPGITLMRDDLEDAVNRLSSVQLRLNYLEEILRGTYEND